MAAITNTYQTHQAKGLREDLTDDIYDISPEDTPFMSSIGKGTAKAVLHEWQTDALTAPSTANQQIEGDDITSFTAITPTVRLGNYLNISRKELILSGTLEAVDKAGRDSELAYQLSRRSVELKRDMESAMLNNIAGSAGSSTTPRIAASILAFLKTNVDKHATGTNPSYTSGVPNAARGDGTQRAFTTTILTAVAQLIWNSGGTLKMLSLGGTQKTVASQFNGIATKTYYQSAKVQSAIIGAADVYVSDFGTFSIVPNRWQRNRDGLFLDPSYASVVYLRRFKVEDLAKTGDAKKKMLLVEWTLKIHNEAAHGLCADLT